MRYCWQSTRIWPIKTWKLGLHEDLPDASSATLYPIIERKVVLDVSEFKHLGSTIQNCLQIGEGTSTVLKIFGNGALASDPGNQMIVECQAPHA